LLASKAKKKTSPMAYSREYGSPQKQLKRFPQGSEINYLLGWTLNNSISTLLNYK